MREYLRPEQAMEWLTKLNNRQGIAQSSREWKERDDAHELEVELHRAAGSHPSILSKLPHGSHVSLDIRSAQESQHGKSRLPTLKKTYPFCLDCQNLSAESPSH